MEIHLILRNRSYRLLPFSLKWRITLPPGYNQVFIYIYIYISYKVFTKWDHQVYKSMGNRGLDCKGVPSSRRACNLFCREERTCVHCGFFEERYEWYSALW